jgi:hypothetical protein
MLPYCAVVKLPATQNVLKHKSLYPKEGDSVYADSCLVAWFFVAMQAAKHG